METSETRYAECAREMLVSGNWLEPTLEFQPHWTKPPLSYWCMALGMELCGVNAWGVRLPAVLALLVTVAAVGLAGRRLWGEREGCLAGLALATGYPAIAANIATTDIYLTAGQAVAGSLFLFAATEAQATRRRAFARWMWLAWGLCFLIKGPPGLLPLIAILPWNRLQPAARRAPLGDVLGIAGALGVGLSWYLLMVFRHPELLGYFVGTEIVGRVSSDVGHNLAWYKVFEVYLPGLLGLAGTLGLWAAWRLLRERKLAAERWRESWRRRDEHLLLVGWMALPLLVFSLSSSKLPLYILPLSVPAALLTAHVLAGRASWSRARNVAVATAGVLVALKLVSARVSSDKDMSRLSADIRAELRQLPSDTALVLWDQPKSHGVAFYLQLRKDELPARVALAECNAFETWTVRDCVRRFDSPDLSAGALVVVSARLSKNLAPESVLAPGRIQSERHTGHWRLLRVRGNLDVSVDSLPGRELAH